jgi:hypothetical protein
VSGGNCFAADTPFGGCREGGIGRKRFEGFLETKSVAVSA